VFWELERLGLRDTWSHNFGSVSSQSELGKFSLYLDPMFAKAKQKSLSRKEMAWMYDLVGPDEDADENLEAALKMGFNRIVVKRPLKAQYNGVRAHNCLKGKTVRYDIYLT
jgi:hypothetical protein